MNNDSVSKLRQSALDAASMWRKWENDQFHSSGDEYEILKRTAGTALLDVIAADFPPPVSLRNASRLLASIGFAVLREGVSPGQLMRELGRANFLLASASADLTAEALQSLARWIFWTFDAFENAERLERDGTLLPPRGFV